MTLFGCEMNFAHLISFQYSDLTVDNEFVYLSFSSYEVVGLGKQGVDGVEWETEKILSYFVMCSLLHIYFFIWFLSLLSLSVIIKQQCWLYASVNTLIIFSRCEQFTVFCVKTQHINAVIPHSLNMSQSNQQQKWQKKGFPTVNSSFKHMKYKKKSSRSTECRLYSA